MSLFGSLMGGDFDDDVFGNHMNVMNMQMRSVNRLMNSLMPDPFNMLTPFDPGFQQNAMMERVAPPPMGGLFGFPAMPNMNRLLSTGPPNGSSFCSSSVITMSSGPDGRPQIYQATTSTKTGPGGIRETRNTMQDSTRGLKKMAIGHHIGERAHIIEKEQDLRSGQLEERQEFINLDEEEAEDFDREFTTRARRGRPQEMLAIEPTDDDERPRHGRHAQQPSQHRRQLPALPAIQQPNHTSAGGGQSASSVPMSSSSSAAAMNYNNNNNNHFSNTPRRAYRSHHHVQGATARRPLRTPSSSPLATTPTNYSHSTASSPSVHPHPYNAAAARRNYRAKHTKQHQLPHATAPNATDASCVPITPAEPLTIHEIVDDDDDDDVDAGQHQSGRQ